MWKEMYEWLKNKLISLIDWLIGPRKPQEASLVIYPLSTMERTQVFFDEVMNMKCDCPKCWMSMNTVDDVLNAGPDEHGYYGMRATTLENGKVVIVAYKSIVECQVITNIEQCVYKVRTFDSDK